MNLDIEVSTAGVVVMRPAGRLDASVSAAFRQRVAETVGSRSNRIVVDLQGVTFLDSSGLGALISALKTARQHAGDLRIAAPNEQARVILELTSLDKVLRPYGSVQEALASYA